MMKVTGQLILQYAIVFVLLALPAGVLADSSSVEDFTSIVNTGAIKQTTSGSGNRQDLNVGSATSTKANSFNANVTTGSITQSSSGTGIVQSANIGSANNAKVDSFTATVNTGKIEQISNRSGDRQELDIGSVNNSTVNGAFKANVKVKEGVKQTGSGEVVLGSVKNSNVQDFSTTLEVKGKVTGNNIRIGSIVGGERFDNDGKSQGQEKRSDNNSNSSMNMPVFSSPNFKSESNQDNLTNFEKLEVGISNVILKTSDVATHIPVLGSTFNFALKSTEFFGESLKAGVSGGTPPPTSLAIDALKDSPKLGTVISTFTVSRDATEFIVESARSNKNGGTPPPASKGTEILEKGFILGVEILEDSLDSL